MNAVAIIREARRDGLRLSLTPAGTIRAGGPREAVVRWEASLRQHKSEIVAALADAGAAIPAIPASRQPGNSKNSGNSRAAVSHSSPEAHRCGCGKAGSIGVGWFLRQPDRATWYCSPCFRALRAAGRA